MTIGAIILCRCDSHRLPGKVLKQLEGKPLLEYVILRCQQVKEINNQIVVATTVRTIDDPIVEYCSRKKINVFRGSSHNVSERLLSCALNYNWQYFFRVNADSPFIEVSLLSFAYTLAKTDKYDLITNLYPRSFPYGVSVEICNTKKFQKVCEKMKRTNHLEHPTSFFYENMEQFDYFNILKEGDNLSKLKMTVDTQEDWFKFENLVHNVKDQVLSLSYLDFINHYQTIIS